MIRQIGHDGWLGIGWPEEWGGQNRSMMDQLIFTDEAAIAGVPIPYLTLNTVGPDDHALRQRRPEAGDAAEDRQGRDALLDRLLRAGIGHRPRQPEHDGAARGRRVGHQRPEDVDLLDPVRRLHLARLPHRSRPAPSQGALDDPGAGRQPGLLLHARAHRRRRRHQRDLLRGRARASREPRRRAQRRLGTDDQPAQPRARGAHVVRAGHPLDRAGHGVGAAHAQPRRQPGDRLGVGADPARSRPGPGRHAQAAQLAARLPRSRTSPPPTLLPRRSTAPRWPRRSTAR